MNKNDIEFLINLQNEMNNQDTCCQANPRFWVVIQDKRIYGIDSWFAYDGVIITDDDGNEYEDNIDDLFLLLHDDLEIDCYIDKDTYNDNRTIIRAIDRVLEDALDVYNYIDNYLDYEHYKLIYYRDEKTIAENTFFLTKKECEEHIKMNSYHYRNAHPYAMTAWRSPQVERLYKILQETNWNELKEVN